MSDEPLLRVDGVWKKYSRTLAASLKYGARDAIGEALNRREAAELRDEEFWAIRDVSFEVRRGDAVGLMGRNGAGKSTLLKVLSGILRPDRGSVTMRGAVEQMIEMSGGFKADLTGRENIHVRAKLLGFSKKQAASLVDDVVAFTELREFIDSPVSFYSSGMKARLGFALSTLRTPDLLIVDEALAAGDLSFRLKCYERISAMLKTSALLLVSHTTSNVRRFCNLGGFMRKGELVFIGELQHAIRAYQDEFVEAKNKNLTWRPELMPVSWRSNGEEIEDRQTIPHGGNLKAVINVEQLPANAELFVRLRIPDGMLLCQWASRHAGTQIGGKSKVEVELGPLDLGPNYYAVNVEAFTPDGAILSMSSWRQFKIVGDYINDIPVQRIGQWSVA